jgi:molecular chaperone HtpG
MSTQKLDFKTEVKQLLDLMIHSLYSHKEIAIRELISNASDAIDKLRYESLTNSDLIEGKVDWKIKLIPDKKARTLTIRDNGIGMTHDEIIEALGTIAHSGTKEFLSSLKEKDIADNPELIGQFGVGFYSSFMIADKVTVLSRKAGLDDAEGVTWQSSADGSYTVEDTEKREIGTEVILHIKKDEEQYLDEWQLRNIVKQYSDYIEYPIVMDVEREKESVIDNTKKVSLTEEEPLNSMKAIWLKDKNDVSPDEYNDFYKHITHDFADPARIIHYKAEGTSEFSCLFYIPAKAPFDIFYKDYKVGPMLYVRRVKIMDHCEELIPLYLRFIKGVIDSSDLPLNISRELLQKNRQVEIIRNNVTKKVLDILADLKKNEYDSYVPFYNEFGRILKEGMHYDFSRKETIADLLLFHSTKTERSSYKSLQEYINSMKDSQEEIYYVTGRTVDEVLSSPYLEAFREKDYEVLIMLDDIDDFIFSNLDYKGKKFKSITKGEISLDASGKTDREETIKKYAKLIDMIKDQLKEEVKDVRLSGRLKDSACCLVTDEGDLDPRMEQLLKAMGQEVPSQKRILEINPDHQIFESMNRLFEKDKEIDLIKEYIALLYDQALLLEGSRPKDPVLLAKYISKLMIGHAQDRILE